MSEANWWFVLLLFEAVGLWGQWKVGSGRWWAWAVVMLHSVPWFIVCVAYQNYGAALMPPLWWTVNLMNLFRWKRNVSTTKTP